MKLTQNGFIRIVGNFDLNELDEEKLVADIQKQYNIDIRTLPYYRDIVNRLQNVSIYCNEKIKNSRVQEKNIIEKLFIQSTRPSPFLLTALLARTAKKWEKMQIKEKKQRLPSFELEILQPTEDVTQSTEWNTVQSSEQNITPPNTKVVPSLNNATQREIQSQTQIIETDHRALPAKVVVNPHRTVSALTPLVDSIYASQKELTEAKKNVTIHIEPPQPLKSTTLVKCVPEKIVISDNTQRVQTLKFALVNCSTEFLFVRFKCITNETFFTKILLTPKFPTKLYPGIRIVFTLVFRLLVHKENFMTSFVFKIGHNVLMSLPDEALEIPVIGDIKKLIAMPTIADLVEFKPVYPWHVNEKCGFPKKYIKIQEKNGNAYILRIIIHKIDYVDESSGSYSICVEEENEQNKDTNALQNAPSDKLTSDIIEESDICDFITFILEEIVELALEPFIFENTYVELTPYSTLNIPIYFTKVEHTGYHQRLYDVQFSDPNTNNLYFTKNVKVFAEVLRHPVKIVPELLDMSNAPVTHGYCEDQITVHNTHKIFNVRVKILLTTKMRKLFCLNPTELLIPPESKAAVFIRLCSRDLRIPRNYEYSAYFTIKILFSGLEAIYYNVPPLYYEIIVPCTAEFKQVYNKKYFRE